MKDQNKKITHLTKTVQNGGKLRNEGDFLVISSYTDVEEEYRVLRNDIAVIDCSAVGKFRITGDQHTEFLNQLTTKDIEFLDTERLDVSLLLDETGQIIDIVTLYKEDNSVLVECSVSKRDQVWNWLNKKNADEIELEDASDTLAIIAIEGPYSWKLAQTLIDVEISSLPFQTFVETEWNGAKMIVARTGVTGEYGYKFIVSMQSSVPLWEYLLGSAHGVNHVQAAGFDALEIAMLEVRQPNIEVEGNGLSVYEAGLEWFISFCKDGFVGLDALTKQKANGIGQRVIGFTFAKGQSLSSRDKIMIEEVQVGHILQLYYSPTLGSHLGLALIYSDFAVSGIQMEGVNQRGERVGIQTQSSPYVVPNSWSIKMI